MQKQNLEIKWGQILVSLFFILLCVMIFTKYGTTHNHTGSAKATNVEAFYDACLLAF